MKCLGLLAVAIGSASCARPSPGSAAARTGAHGEAGGAAVGPDAAARSPSTATEWSGSYHSEVGAVFVPPEWKGVHWSATASDAGQGGVGDGPMSLKISGGRVSGALGGPLGPAVVDGVAAGATITATVLRRDPADLGFSGILIAEVDAGTARGTMNVSLAHAGAVRQVTFSLETPAPSR